MSAARSASPRRAHIAQRQAQVQDRRLSPVEPRAASETAAALASSGVRSREIWRPGWTATRWEVWRCWSFGSSRSTFHSIS